MQTQTHTIHNTQSRKDLEEHPHPTANDRFHSTPLGGNNQHTRGRAQFQMVSRSVHSPPGGDVPSTSRDRVGALGGRGTVDGPRRSPAHGAEVGGGLGRGTPNNLLAGTHPAHGTAQTGRGTATRNCPQYAAEDPKASLCPSSPVGVVHGAAPSKRIGPMGFAREGSWRGRVCLWVPGCSTTSSTSGTVVPPPKPQGDGRDEGEGHSRIQKPKCSAIETPHGGFNGGDGEPPCLPIANSRPPKAEQRRAGRQPSPRVGKPRRGGVGKSGV